MSAGQDIVMPKLGLTMTEGRLAEWKVKPRQQIRQGDILFVVETEKIANEVEAESAGEIAEIVVPAGEVVPVGAVVAGIAASGAAVKPAAAPAPAASPPPP